MNIKSISNNTIATERTQAAETTKEVKSENSSKDRDADGRRQREEEAPKGKLTDEELTEAVSTLESLDGVKKNNLKIELVQSGEVKVALVKDINGNVIRRIPEYDLWTLTQEKSKKTGQLYSKAM